MNWHWKRAQIVFATGFILLLTACGSPESSTSTVPEVSPTPTPGPSTTTTPTAPSADNRLPDLTGSVPLKLTNASNLIDLQAIAGQVFPNLVGDPKILMHLTSNRSIFTAGDILVGFEDQKGWWGASLPIVSRVSTYSPTLSDLIFTDPIPPPGYDLNSLLTFRTVLQTVTADGESEGTIYYRVRQSGEIQCQTITHACQVFSAPACFGMAPPAMNETACVDYMKTTNSSVKKLGTFRVKFSSWVILKD